MSYKEIKIFPLGIGVKEISKRSKLGLLSIHLNAMKLFRESFLVVLVYLYVSSICYPFMQYKWAILKRYKKVT